ncbi:MAG: hypothetical protein ABIP97_00405 [Chthoniobacterales bacterium]
MTDGWRVKFLSWRKSESSIRWIQTASFLCVLLLVFIGWQMRNSITDIPLSDPDTKGYLNPALSWLSGLGFLQSNGREWFYSAVLAGILKFGGNFTAISHFQQIFGLLGTLILWLAVVRWLSLLAAGNTDIHLLGHFLLIPALALYVLNPNVIIFEKFVRPESLMLLFVFCYFLALVSFFIERWQRGRIMPAILYGSAVLFSSFMVFQLKASWTLALPLSLLPLLAGIFGKGSLSLRIGPLVGGVILAGLFMTGPRVTHFQKEERTITYLPYTLVSIHAEGIVEDGKKRMLTAPPEQKDILSHFIPDLEKALIEAKKHPEHFWVVGYQADDIMYLSGVFEPRKYNPAWDIHSFTNFCYSLYFNAWLGAPVTMLEKVGRQLPLFLFPKTSDYFYMTGKRPKGYNYQHSLDALHADHFSLSSRTESLYANYLADLRVATGQPNEIRTPALLVFLGTLLARIGFWIQLVFLLTLLTAFQKSEFAAKLAGLCVLSLLASVWGYIMTIALVHTLDNSRYRTTLTAFYGTVLIMMLIFSIATLTRVFFNYKNRDLAE